VDWGENSVEVVKYLMLMSSMYENVKCTIGNHDYFTYKVLLGEGDRSSDIAADSSYYELSSYNNGRATLRAFDKESEDGTFSMARWLEDLPVQYEAKVGKQKYVLTHSSPQMYDMSPEELI
jgi:hypothetical protein